MNKSDFDIKTEQDYVGSPDVLKKIDQAIREMKPILLAGSPGSGKTVLAYFIAKKYNLDVVEFNASDERKREDFDMIKRRISMRSFGKPLYLFDEIDGIKSFKGLEEILTISQYSIILTANELWEIPKSITTRCVVIQIKKPILQAVSTKIKTLGAKLAVQPKFTGIQQDVRHSIISAFYGGHSYTEHDIFDIVDKIFSGMYDESMNIDKSILVWLLDNASSFYYGKSLYNFIQILCKIDISNNLDMLKYVQKGLNARISYPYYYKRLSILKGEKSGQR